MRPPRWTLKNAMLGIGGIAVALGFVDFLVRANQGSNCGGNTVALNAVKTYMVAVEWLAVAHPDRSVRIEDVAPELRGVLADTASDLRHLGARLLVVPPPYEQPDGKSRRILIVCDQPFTNIPRRVWGSAPPTHAAGFSDGSCRLITAQEFAVLDRSALVPLDELLAATEPDDDPTAPFASPDSHGVITT